MRVPVLAALLALVVVPALADDPPPDADAAAQRKEEARLLKRARRHVADDEKKEALELFMKLGDLARERKHDETAVTAYSEAVPLAEGDAEKLASVLDALYRTRFHQADYAGALKDGQRLLELKPEDAVIANNVGALLHKTGRDAEAVKQFERCLELDPACALARVSLGCVARLAGKPRKALRAHEQLLARAKTAALDTGGWSIGFESAKMKARGEGGSLETEPQRVAFVTLEVAIDHAFLDDLDEAEKVLARARETFTESDLEPALDDAIDELERALELRPAHFQLRYLLALLHGARGDAAAEKAELEKFIAAEKRAHALAKKQPAEK